MKAIFKLNNKIIENEKIQDFYKNIDNFKEYVSKGTGQYLVLLIDGSLI